MPRQSAGLLLYRLAPQTEVLLVYPGGPLWVGKDIGGWAIPKGEPKAGEDLLQTAQREFLEETSFPPHPPFHPLDTIRQAGGKLVTAWAFEGDCDPAELRSNTCQIEWPPRSGRRITIPEIDRGAWFSIPEAHTHIREAQRPFLTRLEAHLATREINSERHR